jgi:hypothetical protein
VRYEIDKQTNTIAILEETGKMKDEEFKFATLGIIISNGLSLKKDNIFIKRDDHKTQFESF